MIRKKSILMILFIMTSLFLLVGCSIEDLFNDLISETIQYVTYTIVEGENTREVTVEHCTGYSIATDIEGFTYWDCNGTVCSYNRQFYLSGFFSGVFTAHTDEIEQKMTLLATEEIVTTIGTPYLDIVLLYTNPQELEVTDWGLYYTTFEEDFGKDITEWSGLQKAKTSARTMYNESDFELPIKNCQYVAYVVTNNGTSTNPIEVYHYSDVKLAEVE